MHNARKENLMKNKNKFAFLTLFVTFAMLLGACNSGNSSTPEESSNNPTTSETGSSLISSIPVSEPVSSSQPTPSSKPISSNPVSEIPSSVAPSSNPISSSTPQVITYTVTFKVDGQVVQTSPVQDGELVTYEGETPTKAGDANASKYRFVGWDRDLSLPITADTVINAVFEAYYDSIFIDDFESYEDSASMIDEGWFALGYTSSGWTEETKAAVSLSTNAADGKQALRFDAWQNGVGYKAVKAFKDKEFTQPANALAFKIMVPATTEIKVLLHATATIQGQLMAPSFTYTIGKPISGEYVDYVIPLADDGWALWGEAGKSIKAVAEWSGIDQDDILSYLTKIEFYFAGNDNLGGQPYIGFIDSVKFITLDNPVNTAEDHVELFGSYTGTLDNENKNILRVDINNDGSATASIIDLEVPQTVNGNVALEGREVTFTSSDSGATLQYKGKITNGGKLIKYVSATGALANSVLDMDLIAVQLVENFEQYDKDGTAYYQSQTDINARSGCRGAYYSEYYSGSGSTEWGGNGWSLLGGDGSQLKLKSDGAGHNGSKNYLCLKNSRYNAIRYMQWGLFDGTSEQNSFRGSKISFWARTNGLVPAFKVACYSQTTPRNATKDYYVKSETFNCSEPIAEWTHYEIELNPNYVYYGFLVFMEKNSKADSYLYIDDVEIYGANPYARFEAPAPIVLPTVQPGTCYFGGAAGGAIYSTLGFVEDNYATLMLTTSISLYGKYEINDREVVCNLESGKVIYTATMSDDASQLIFKSVTGTKTEYVNALVDTSYEILDYAEVAESYEKDGLMYYQGNMNENNINGARGAYYCDYQAGNANYSSPLGGSGWILMGGSGDQLKLNTTSPLSGLKSLEMKKSSAGAMRYIQWDLYKGTAKPHTHKDHFIIEVRNNADNETKVKVMVFKEQKLTLENFGTSYVSEEMTLAAGEDTFIEMDLDYNETYYGYGIMFEKDSKQAYLTVDNAEFTDLYTDFADYLMPNEMVLNSKGDISASIKFTDHRTAYITYAALGLNNVECSYTMTMWNGHAIAFTINDKEIQCSYVATLDGTVTLTIDSVESSLASYLPVGTVFSNK